MTKICVGFIAALLTAVPLVRGQSVDLTTATDSPPFVDAETGTIAPIPDPITYHPSDDRLWMRNEYLLWWTKATPVPVPALTGVQDASVPDPPEGGVPGAIGTPGTVVLLGGDNVATGEHHGGRFTIGYWLNDARTVGLEGNYFFLAANRITQQVDSTSLSGDWLLGVPYYDVNATYFVLLGMPAQWAAEPGESFAMTAATGFQEGRHTLVLTNRLLGCELNAVANQASSDLARVDLLSGFRFLQFDEMHHFTVDSLVVDDFLQGLNVVATDEFNAYNRFYGTQIGARAVLHRQKWNLEATGKLALGNMQQIVDVIGLTQLTFPTEEGPVTVPISGAFGAEPTNMGRHIRDVFAVVPELTLRVGYDLNRRINLFVGYNFLYASNVARPSEQIDHVGNVSRSPLAQALGAGGEPRGPLRPAFDFHGSGFWTQGINFGFEFRL